MKKGAKLLFALGHSLRTAPAALAAELEEQLVQKHWLCICHKRVLLIGKERQRKYFAKVMMVVLRVLSVCLLNSQATPEATLAAFLAPKACFLCVNESPRNSGL